MEIVFDREEAASWGISGDSINSPEHIVRRLEERLRVLGEFCQADRVEYSDWNKSETYEIRRGDQTLVMSVCGNQFDGGWMTSEIVKSEKSAK